MNKYLTLILSLGLIGSLFVGCDSEPAEHQENEGLQSETEQATKEKHPGWFTCRIVSFAAWTSK